MTLPFHLFEHDIPRFIRAVEDIAKALGTKKAEEVLTVAFTDGEGKNDIADRLAQIDGQLETLLQRTPEGDKKRIEELELVIREAANCRYLGQCPGCTERFRDVMNHKPINPAGHLRAMVLEILETNDSRCMDDAEDRVALADALVKGLK